MPSKNPPLAVKTPNGSPPAPLWLPGDRELPSVNDHVVRPETREEMVRGRRVYAAPALEPHGDAHSELGFAVRGHVRPGYIVSTDLLTHVLYGSDFATDTCIRKAGTDPATRTRYLEEVAFEIVNEQSLRDITERAEDLAARGVRRIFAIFVKRGEVAEWSAAEGSFRHLGPDEIIEDASLVRPLPVKALLLAAENDDAVAQALVAKKNPVIEEVRQSGLREGRQSGLREGWRGAAEELCAAFGIELTDDHRAALDTMDASELASLVRTLGRERRWPG